MDIILILIYFKRFFLWLLFNLLHIALGCDKIQVVIKMLISKTVFKEYTRCPRVCALDNLYMKKLHTDASLFSDDKADFLDLLASMFDVDTGEDLLTEVDPQYEALISYYHQLENEAMRIAEKMFGEKIIHNIETKKQKYFTYNQNNHQYITYLDGYQELENEVRVFEVKATSSRKFINLGAKIDGVHHSIFKIENNILKLAEDPDLSLSKFNQNYEKLLNRYHEAGKYVFDLAVERYFIEKSIKDNIYLKNKDFHYYLVVLNTDYTYDGLLGKAGNNIYNQDKNGHELVTFIDLTDVTKVYLEKIEALNHSLLTYIDKLSLDEVPLGIHCERKSQAKCAFIKSCWAKAFEKGSILEYIGNHLGFKDELGKTHSTLDLINDGYLKLDSIPKEWLERRNNLIQRDCYESGQVYINQSKIKKAIETLQYPLYHLDFESFPCPLPRFKGEHPYMQSVFQFSLHIEREKGVCDLDKDNYYYLANNEKDNRLELVQKLIAYIDLSKGGTVIVYNKSFEHSRIKELSNIFPQYKKELLKINEHMFDLLDIVFTRKDFYQQLGFEEEESKTINYYHNDLKGSFSIKKVLPLFSNLSYHGLAVGNGTEAIAAYAKFKDLDSEDLEVVRNDLITYCKQDTYAMVLILWKLQEYVL